jgi:hypothetical protein
MSVFPVEKEETVFPVEKEEKAGEEEKDVVVEIGDLKHLCRHTSDVAIFIFFFIFLSVAAAASTRMNVDKTSAYTLWRHHTLCCCCY